MVDALFVLRCTYVENCNRFSVVRVVYVVRFAAGGIESVMFEYKLFGVNGLAGFAYVVVEPVYDSMIRLFIVLFDNVV